jgi:hypothetical protein
MNKRMSILKAAVKQCGLATVIIGLALLSRRRRTSPTSGQHRASTMDQSNQECDADMREPERKRPAWVLSLERYRVLIELLASLATVFALVALGLSYQSVKSSNRSAESSARAAESAQRSIQLQEAQLQPVFLVQVDYDRQQRGPTKQHLRVIGASGTFLDAHAEETSLLVLGEDFGDRALVPLIDPYWSPTDQQRDPKARGVLIASWESDGAWLSKAKCIWQEQLGQFSDLSYVVSFVKVEYRDISRKEHQLYFRIGGRASKYSRFAEDQIPLGSPCAISHTTELKGTMFGRGETIGSSDAVMCMSTADRQISSALVGPHGTPTKKELKSAFDAYKNNRSSAVEERCAPEVSPE